MINKFDLQLFADESPETISGKKLVYLFRVAEDSKTEKMLILHKRKMEMFVHLVLLKLKSQVHHYCLKGIR